MNTRYKEFTKIVNPIVRIRVWLQPNGQIIKIDNKCNIRFPWVVGQIMPMNHQTWANVNGYKVKQNAGILK